MAVKPIPEGYSTLTPYLTVDDANGAIEFYKRAVGAAERMRMAGADGKVMHAELRIGDSIIMLSDAFPGMGSPTARELGGSPISLLMYVEAVDQAYERAVKAGATPIVPPADQFWGDRWGRVADPYGLTWQLATNVEEVSPEEMEKRMAAMQA
jgi:PhnB protein